MRLRLRACAKLNLTLEVLCRRSDGYHDLATVFQTIDLYDTVVLSRADRIELRMTGAVDELTRRPAEDNLAYRAAVALREEAGNGNLGALIELEKRIPAAAGLGGGSSDAAAVLRGLKRIWGLDLDIERLARIGASLGADVPFFLHGGTAQAGGRGDEVAPLPDSARKRLLLVVPRLHVRSKTASMYAALTSQRYSDGSATQRLTSKLAGGGELSDGDLCNAFESIVGSVMPAAASLMQECRHLGLSPHLSGSGPAFFVLRDDGDDVADRIQRRLSASDVDLIETATVTAVESTAWDEV